MYLAIRSGQFEPDATAIDRILEPPVDDQVATVNATENPEGEAGISDSESSLASESDFDESLDLVPTSKDAELPFRDLPGVPWCDLVVHRLSGIVHVVNEDDSFVCGRKNSANYRAYQSVANLGHHFEGCAQCSKSIRNAGPSDLRL